VSLTEVGVQAVLHAVPGCSELDMAVKTFEVYAEIRHFGFLKGVEEYGFEVDAWAKRQLRDSLAKECGYIWYLDTHLLDGNNDDVGPTGEYSYPVPVIQTKTFLIKGTDGVQPIELGPLTYSQQAIRGPDEVQFTRNEKTQISYGHNGELVYQCYIRKAYFPSAATAPAAQLTRYGKILADMPEIKMDFLTLPWNWPSFPYWVQPDARDDLEALIVNMPGMSKRKYKAYHVKGETGIVSYYDIDSVDTCFAKSDEILCDRKARIITNAHPSKFVNLQGLVQESCNLLIEVGMIEVFPKVFLTYGAKTIETERDEWWRQVNAAKEGTYIIVAGDDNLICDYRNGQQVWIEGDVSACDQSHGHEALSLLESTLRTIGWPDELVQAFIDGYYAPVKGYYDVQFLKPQLHTGYPFTSFANTLLIGSMCCLAARLSQNSCQPLLTHLKTVIQVFRMTWKIQEVTQTNASFLKGIWVEDRWCPLPSRIWKATTWRTQGKVQKKSIAAHIRGIAQSVQFSSLDPLMRAWCKAVLGPYHLTGVAKNPNWWANNSLSTRQTWEARGGDASMESWASLVSERYGITFSEYEDEIEFFTNHYDVHAFYVRTTRCLVNFVERDYASEGQDAFDSSEFY
jgi:hypothetical protein